MSKTFLERCAASHERSFVERAGGPIMASTTPHTLQVNIGYRCSLACNHCFLECSPASTECMSKETMEDILAVFAAHESFETLDITGGSPEMNPNFEWFLEEGSKIAKKVIVRTNLAILDDPEYAHFVDVYARLKPSLMTSMACSTIENVDKQRGAGTYDKMIRSFKRLNAAGYGIEPDMEINVLFTGLGLGLAPNQANLEPVFKETINGLHGVELNHVYTSAHVLLGRDGKRFNDEEFADYARLLEENFNEANLPSVMCIDQINVDWDGGLYDCDSCHAAGVPANELTTIHALREAGVIPEREVALSDLCYVCTAGAGSSCGGNLS